MIAVWASFLPQVAYFDQLHTPASDAHSKSALAYAMCFLRPPHVLPAIRGMKWMAHGIFQCSMAGASRFGIDTFMGRVPS